MSNKRKPDAVNGDHGRFMSLALRCADSVKGTTFPNPAVGAVVVQNGTVVGWGGTSHYGGPHAEINALEMAGEKARGATLYVTLEPCCHFGKTPPCTDAIIRADISSVYAASADPNPLVAGKSARILRSNGITVSTGLYKKEAMRLNEDFFFWITQSRPWVSVKLAMTLDGRIADVFGTSKWITSDASRRLVHDIRRRHAGIAVGHNTLVADDPHLDVRYSMHGNPARFVFCSKESLPPKSFFFTSAKPAAKKRGQRSIAVVNGGKRSKKILASGVEVWHTGCRDNVASVNEFLSMAHEENIPSILIEGGRKLASHFIEQKIANRLYLFYGNKIIGGGMSGIEFEKALPLAQSLHLDEMEMQQIGNDIMVTGLLG